MHFLVPRVLQKKQPHRHQEVLLQHPLYPQLNVEVSYNGRPRLLKWLFFLKAVVYTRCAQHWVGGRGARTAPFDRVCVGGCFFWRTRYHGIFRITEDFNRNPDGLNITDHHILTSNGWTSEIYLSSHFPAINLFLLSSLKVKLGTWNTGLRKWKNPFGKSCSMCCVS